MDVLLLAFVLFFFVCLFCFSFCFYKNESYSVMEIRMENFCINKVHSAGLVISMWFPPPSAPKTTWQYMMVLTSVIPFLENSAVLSFHPILRAAITVCFWYSRQIHFKQQEVGKYLSGRRWVRIWDM